MDAMGGVPVWLASVSNRDINHNIIGVAQWDKKTMDRACALLLAAVEGVGDHSKQRLFRMNVTLCMHTACSEQEIATLPGGWENIVQGIAGGPVQVLWESIPGSASTKPCEFPKRRVVIPGRPDLWVPQDCGCCDPCVARAKISRL